MAMAFVSLELSTTYYEMNSLHGTLTILYLFRVLDNY